MSITRIPVAGERPYDVVIGTGVLSELPGLVGPEATKVVVIAPESVGDIARPACRALDEAGYQVIVAEVPMHCSSGDSQASRSLRTRSATSAPCSPVDRARLNARSWSAGRQPRPRPLRKTGIPSASASARN